MKGTYTRIIVFSNFFTSVVLGLFAGWAMVSFGLSKYMYYSNNSNRPTKKIFKCGKTANK
jgi:hypothetical protein